MPQRIRTDDGDRDGKQPHAHAAPVAHVDNVGHRAHGAEIDLVADRAEHEAERETAPCNGGAQISGGFHEFSG